MDSPLQVAVEGNQVWKQRCNERMENLMLFSGSDALSQTEELVKDRKIMDLEVYEAVCNGDVDGFVNVLEKVSIEKELSLANIFEQVNQAGDSFLHVAARLGREKITELICSHFPQLLARRNMCGDTSLHVAARSKNSSIIRIILSQYALERSRHDLAQEEVITSLSNAYGDAPLHVAVKSRHIGVVFELLFADDLVTHSPNKLGFSPLYISVLTENLEICSLLLAITFPTPLPQSHGNSPLHAALHCRNTGFLKELVTRRSDLIYYRDEVGGTPLHFAANSGYLEGVRTLLEISSQIAFEKNKKGNLPIHLACKMGHIEVVKELLQKEWLDPTVLLNHKAQNILHVAAKVAENDVVKYLLTNIKIDQTAINGKDVNGNTPLHLAARNFLVQNLYTLSRDKRIKFKLVNNEGLRAVDVVLLTSESPPTLQQRLSELILHSAGSVLSSKVLRMGRRPKTDELKVVWVKDLVNTYMVVSILMITVTFAASFTVPGGFSSDPNTIGMPVMIHNPYFKTFMFFNSIAMYVSTFVCILLMHVRHDDFGSVQRGTGIAMLCLVFALMFMTFGFSAALCVIVGEVEWLVVLITAATFIILALILGVNVVMIPTGSSWSITPVLCDLHLRFLIWYSKAPTMKMFSGKHLDEGKQDWLS